MELLVATTVILILLTSTYVRYSGLVVDAERAAFKGVMGWLQAGLNLEMGRSLSEGGMGQLALLQNTNPMALVEKVMDAPSNYLGELNAEQAEQAESGHWYFDLNQRVLIYRVKYRENLEGIENSRDNNLSFVLKVVYTLADRDDSRSVRRIQLQPLYRDFWNTPLAYGRDPDN